MIIGTGYIKPGVDLIFEGGVKDEIMPQEYYLSENETDVHIEVFGQLVKRGAKWFSRRWSRCLPQCQCDINQ